MREILFRGKRIDNGEWVEGFYHYTNWYHPVTKELAFTNHWILPVGGQDAFQVDPETVGQYTGLIDKNGKKIFEGDIHERVGHYFVVKHGESKRSANEDGRYGWHFKAVKDGACGGFYGDEKDYVNIIGNIHDNPELLEGGE
jgi:uncharacterized phage protein (TIGR01671 family)